jgi:acyl-coenzyme A synthetase/AMP-(fatty) acid ligase
MLSNLTMIRPGVMERRGAWLRQWDKVFEWNFPTFRWSVGAETNLAYSALDRHVDAGRGGHAALAYFNERGERVVLTYAQLLHEMSRIGAALRGLGIRKGDRLSIYMPPCPESLALMLATVRIGPWCSPASAHRPSQTGFTPADRVSCSRLM